VRAWIRWAAVAVVVAGGVIAIAVSRHTSPEAISAAAGVAETPITHPADLPVLAAGPPPSIEAASAWLNTAPISDADLRGKVVLYDFWTFGCINCKHTLPYVKALQQRYAADGLVILSIHTPEFSYEADPANVAEFLAANSITYPVALDPDKRIWRQWQNHYWPAFYLYDAQGRLRLQHFGEGGYDRREDAIRAMLGVDPSSPRAVVV
jgi:thiol-disulfide isomerase/thioredoxin